MSIEIAHAHFLLLCMGTMCYLATWMGICPSNEKDFFTFEGVQMFFRKRCFESFDGGICLYCCLSTCVWMRPYGRHISWHAHKSWLWIWCNSWAALFWKIKRKTTRRLGWYPFRHELRFKRGPVFWTIIPTAFHLLYSMPARPKFNLAPPIQ